MNLAKMYMR